MASAHALALERYHPLQATLHWITAALVLFMLAMGTLSLKGLPNDAAKVFALRGHMIAGIAVGVLMLARLALRLWLKQPAPASAGNPALDRLARGVHIAMYVAALGMAASGIALAVQAGLPDIVFGRSGAPLPEDFWSYAPRWAHLVAAKALMALIGLHVLGAGYHQFVRRDGLLRRMWPGGR